MRPETRRGDEELTFGAGSQPRFGLLVQRIGHTHLSQGRPCAGVCRDWRGIRFSMSHACLPSSRCPADAPSAFPERRSRRAWTWSIARENPWIASSPPPHTSTPPQPAPRSAVTHLPVLKSAWLRPIPPPLRRLIMLSGPLPHLIAASAQEPSLEYRHYSVRYSHSGVPARHPVSQMLGPRSATTHGIHTSSTAPRSPCATSVARPHSRPLRRACTSSR
jgi:hypothetical protein